MKSQLVSELTLEDVCQHVPSASSCASVCLRQKVFEGTCA